MEPEIMHFQQSPGQCVVLRSHWEQRFSPGIRRALTLRRPESSTPLYALLAPQPTLPFEKIQIGSQTLTVDSPNIRK